MFFRAIEDSNQKQIKLYADIRTQNEVYLKLTESILEEIQKKNSIDDIQCANSLYKPLEGFPLTTLQEFQDLNEPENKLIREKLV